MFKKILVTFAIFLSGCAAQVTQLNVADIEKSSAIPVKDERPETEKQKEIFSLLISSDAYGIYRIADEVLAPPAIRLFQHRAYEKFAASTSPLDIKVNHFVIYQNVQSELRRSAIGAGIGGAIGALAAGSATTDPAGVSSSLADIKSFDALEKDEFKRALYSENENPGKGSVAVIYIDTEINGRRVFTRSIAPLKAQNSENPFISGLEASIKYHLAQY